MPVLILFLIGCLGGLLAGLLGVGGGLIFIPVIEHYLSPIHLQSTENVKYILANSIAIVFASGISGIYRQIKMGTWQWRKSLYIGIPGAIASYATTCIIELGDWYHKTDFQWVFLGFLLLSIANMLWGKNNEKNPSIEMKTETDSENQSSHFTQIGIGILAGTTVALSGLGGGVIMVPLFRMALKFPMKQATALSLSIVPMLTAASLFSYATAQPNALLEGVQFPLWESTLKINGLLSFTTQCGYLYFPIVLPMIIATSITTSFAQKNAKHVPVLWLRIIFALLSVIIFIKTIYEIYHS